MGNNKLKILLADDDDTNRKLLKTFLKSLGYNTCEAKTGNDALSKILNEKPDIIILDLSMPEIDSFSILKVIKSKRETRMIPIIITTGNSDNQSYIKAIELGADDFLIKPFSIHLLKARLHSLTSIKMLYNLRWK